MNATNIPKFSAEASLDINNNFRYQHENSIGEHSEPFVIPQLARKLACSLSAGAGSTICGPMAGRCYDALYEYCMGPGGL